MFNEIEWMRVFCNTQCRHIFLLTYLPTKKDLASQEHCCDSPGLHYHTLTDGKAIQCQEPLFLSDFSSHYCENRKRNCEVKLHTLFLILWLENITLAAKGMAMNCFKRMFTCFPYVLTYRLLEIVIKVEDK